MPAAAHLRRLRETLKGSVTLGELASLLGHEGVGALLFLISLPFLQPIPLAGLGTPLGFLIASLGLQIARGRGAAELPAFVARRKLDAAFVARILSGAERLLGFAERAARPRWKALARSPRALGAALVVLGVIFAMPVFVPLGNPISATPLALLGLAIAEEDGLLALLGMAGTAATVAYHAAFARLLWNAAKAFLARF